MNTVKVLVCGDSTAVAYVPPINGAPGYITGNSPAAVAASLLNARPGATQVVMDNISVGGSNISHWLNGGVIDGITITPWAQLMAATDAKIVLLQLGINDAFTAGITVQGYMSSLQTIRNLALSHGKTPIFVTDNPISYSSTHNGILWELMNGVRVCAAQMGMQVVDCNDAIARHVDSWPQFLPDKIHPNETLYHFMGSLLAIALARHITDEV